MTTGWLALATRRHRLQGAPPPQHRMPPRSLTSPIFQSLKLPLCVSLACKSWGPISRNGAGAVRAIADVSSPVAYRHEQLTEAYRQSYECVQLSRELNGESCAGYSSLGSPVTAADVLHTILGQGGVQTPKPKRTTPSSEGKPPRFIQFPQNTENRDVFETIMYSSATAKNYLVAKVTTGTEIQADIVEAFPKMDPPPSVSWICETLNKAVDEGIINTVANFCLFFPQAGSRSC